MQTKVTEFNRGTKSRDAKFCVSTFYSFALCETLAFFALKSNYLDNMKQDYWIVSDDQVIEKTGKKISEWIKILDKFEATEKKSNEVVVYLQLEYNVPRYWAKTLTTHYLKQKAK